MFRMWHHSRAIGDCKVEFLQRAVISPLSVNVQLDMSMGTPAPADLGTILARLAAGAQSNWDASAPYSHPADVAADVGALWAHCRATARMGEPIM